MLRLVTFILISIAALALSVVSAIGIVTTLQRPLPEPVIEAWTPKRTAASDVPALHFRPIEAYPEIVTRPVFYEGRRFPVIEPPKPAPIQPPIAVVNHPPVTPPFDVNSLRLHGIATFDGHARALIDAPGLQTDWLSEGAQIHGWTISRVEAQAVTLKSGGQTARVELWPRR